MSRKSQGKILPMVKFREIIRLHEQGYNQSEIAVSCEVARSTVQDYIRRASAKGLSYAQLEQLSDSTAQEYLGKGRQKPGRSAAINFAPVHAELQRKGVTLALLWQEGIDRGEWNCSYGGFCRLYNRWKVKQNLSMRQVHKAGEKLFVDYCGLSVPVKEPSSGEVIDAQIFVACLGASNYTYAEASPSQNITNWLGAHQRALEFLGGVPKCIVPDNLKSGISDPCRYEPGINRSYHDFAQHYGTAVIPARPYKPRDKAKVEKAVQEIERQILAPLRHQTFYSFSELNAAIAVGLERLNHKTMKSYGLSRAQMFEQVDQPALQPLPSHPFVLANWKSAKVNLDYHIEVERHYYSVPYWLVRHQVLVKSTEHLIEIYYDNQRVACHERSQVSHRHTTLPEHMPPEHWAYKSQSKHKFLAWAAQIGTQPQAQVEAIFATKDHEEQAFRTIKGLQSLATRYGSKRLEAACARANTFGMVGLRRLKSILSNNLEATSVLNEALPNQPLCHANLRGQAYYQSELL
jgi:transposase